jgi:peptidylprolyl isomerase
LPIKNGDFILIDYTLKVKETGETVGTTDEKVAKENKLYRGEEQYEPYFVVVGEGWVPKGLDELLPTLEIGKSNNIELPPEKAYGARDPKRVRLVPLRKFSADGITPVPGLQVNMDGKTAQIRSVGAGRVQVDYNHPFAGRTLIYDVTAQKVIETDEDRVRNLVHKRLPTVNLQKINVKMDNEKLEIEIPEEAFFLEGLQVAKRTMAADVQKYLSKIETITFLEHFKKPNAITSTETKPAEAAPSAATAAQPSP